MAAYNNALDSVAPANAGKETKFKRDFDKHRTAQVQGNLPFAIKITAQATIHPAGGPGVTIPFQASRLDPDIISNMRYFKAKFKLNQNVFD